MINGEMLDPFLYLCSFPPESFKCAVPYKEELYVICTCLLMPLSLLIMF